jgi:hypothetical protein
MPFLKTGISIATLLSVRVLVALNTEKSFEVIIMDIKNNQNYLDALTSMEKAFSTVPRPKTLDSCHCCHDAPEKVVLLNTGLKHLSGQPLENFIFSVFSTIGDEESFKYFLPRVLELVALGEFGDWCSLGLLGRKIAESNYQEWPDPLSNSVDSMLKIIWQEGFLKQEISDDTGLSTDLLCMIGNAVTDIQPYLDDLFKVPSHAAIVWESEIESARSGKVFDVFWENEVNKQTVINWVLSKEVEDLVMPVYLEILNTRYDYG